MKLRLDELLIKKGLFESRNKAQAAVITGIILVDEKKIDKPGIQVDEGSVIRIIGEVMPYVSRGGLKLERALDDFKVDVKGLTVADIGAGTGGFTDCVLQRGAKKVFAIDVGYGQLAWKLRQDKRVVVMERRNAREMTAEDLGEAVDLVVMDVSFISIIKILPAISAILKDDGAVVTLIKPQFEAGKGNVPRGGVIRNKNVHQKVLEKIRSEVAGSGFRVVAESTSPITGRDGNTEFFMHLRKA